MYICSSCGGQMRYNIEQQGLLCDHCGMLQKKVNGPARYIAAEFSTVSADEATHTSPSAAYDPKSDTMDVTIYTCPSCGAQLMGDDNAAATFCSFCGDSVMLETRMQKQKKPDKIIPFKITKEQAAKHFLEKQRSSPFTPDELRNDAVIDRIRPIYMPYWVYKTSGRGSVKYIEVEDDGDYNLYRRIKLEHKCSISGYAMDAAVDFPDDMSEDLEPFSSTASAVNFSPFYVSGYYADLPNTNPQLYDKYACEYSKKLYKEHNTPVRVKNSTVTSQFEVTNRHLELRPVWFVSSRFKDRVSYGVVNGETGKLKADMPTSIKRFLCIAAVISAVFFALLLILSSSLQLLPKHIVAITLVVSAIEMLMLGYMQKNAILTEMGTFDLGAMAFKGQPELAQKKRQRLTRKKLIDTSKEFLCIFLVILGIFAVFALLWLVSPDVGMYVLIPVVSTILCIPPVALIRALDASSSYTNAMLTTPSDLDDPLTSDTSKEGQFNKSNADETDEDRQKRKALQKQQQKNIRRLKLKIVSRQLLSLLKLGIGCVACTAVLYIKPVNDWWYYGACLLNCFLLLWGVFDAINLHNRKATRPLPQLKRREAEA